jgi:hypothetical protein
MAPTLEDLDRRVTALELAQSARSENAVARLEQKMDAFPHVVAETIAELRGEMGAKIAASEDRLRGAISVSVDASEKRMRAELRDRIGASEGRIVDTLNDRFDAVMTALERPKSP